MARGLTLLIPVPMLGFGDGTIPSQPQCKFLHLLVCVCTNSISYAYDVNSDGGWCNRQTFAYIDSGVPDGVHCDTAGNVYAGCGDGVHVWNKAGGLLGKIYLGEGSANFQFAGKGRMVICAETQLYYVQFAAEGNRIENYDYSNMS